MFDSILASETEVFADVRTHGIRVEMDGIQTRNERRRQSSFSGARQTHDQDFLGSNRHGRSSAGPPE
jgi:hypothetical protein